MRQTVIEHMRRQGIARRSVVEYHAPSTALVQYPRSFGCEPFGVNEQPDR
jgi:hypothetical protein